MTIRHADLHLIGITDAAVEAARSAYYESPRSPDCPTGTADELLAYCLRAALEAAAPFMGPQWAPIETAPKDGTKVLLHCKGGIVLIAEWLNVQYDRSARRYFGCWSVSSRPLKYQPTHWMPLPPPPLPQEER